MDISRCAMKPLIVARALCLAGALTVGPPVASWCVAQGAATSIQPGFNLFTVQQDVELGRASAVEAEKQLHLLNSPSVDAWLNRVIQKLAAVAPGAQYPYHIQAVNAAELNAFSLPGGPMYVNRGLLSAVSSEAELAGVLAHEMAHVALRHGTHQASTAYLAQSGLSLLGGLLGRNGGQTADIINAVGGVGLNVAFLKFSRGAEYDADATGAEIMARAGYNPTAMADVFQKLRAEQGRDPSKLEQFLSDHPASAERESRIRTQARSLAIARASDIGGLATIQSSFSDMAAAPAQSAPGSATAATQPGATATTASGPVATSVGKASKHVTRFEQAAGFFTVSYPDNWRALPASSGVAVSFVPQGGIAELSNGRQVIVEGVIVNHYAPFQAGSSGTLKNATDDLVEQLVRSNSYLRPQGAARATRTRGIAGYAVKLAGASPVTGEAEQVTVVTQALSDGHVVYVLGITPGRLATGFDPVFGRMLQSLRLNDQGAHRSAGDRAARE